MRPEYSKETFRTSRCRCMPPGNPGGQRGTDDQRDPISLTAQFIRMRLIEVNHDPCDGRA
jgi:hypothetical protein